MTAPVPLYGTSSLAELMPSMLSALEVPGLANALSFETTDRACLLLVDGLGWEQLRAHAKDAPFLASLVESGSALTAGFPSTTAASIASIGTGRPPGEHGLVGYTVAVPGHERAMNVLLWELYGTGPRVDMIDEAPPAEFQPEPTAFERATDDGVAVSLVGPPAHAHSGMTRAVLRGGRYRGAYSMGDLVAETARALTQTKRSFVYAYHPDLDTTGHVRGAGSEPWRLHLGHVDRMAEALAERLPRRATLVVTGDHGMINLAEAQRVDIDDNPELMAGVRFLGGEARARHVYTHAHAAADVLAAWNSLLGDRMWVLSRDDAIGAGWFGPRVPDRVRPRIGDVVAAAHGLVGVVQRSVDPLQARLVGHHGSMTPAEQMVPLLTVRR